MNKRVYKQIEKAIKKYDSIVIARHIGADPDALGSTLALRDIIKNTYPNKKVYAVGSPASKFKYIGVLDKYPENLDKNSLLFVLDTPDLKRIDGALPSEFAYSIKIDHHPFVEKTCDLEWIDDSASSTSQMIMELVFSSKLKMTKEAGEKLFIGLVADTNRFLFQYTTPKTFSLTAKLIATTHLNFTPLYDALYVRPCKELKFQGYIANHFKITESGFAYIILNQEILDEYNVDAATAGNMINQFNYIEEFFCWAFFSYDKNNDVYRGSIRSRGPIINEIVASFGGGGHIYASGVRLNTEEEIDALVAALDKECQSYKDKIGNF